jgi:hypothetical protein
MPSGLTSEDKIKHQAKDNANQAGRETRSDNKTQHSVISFCSPHFATAKGRRKYVRLLPPFLF